MRKTLFFILLPFLGMSQKNYPELLKDYMQKQVTLGFSGAVLVVKNDKVLMRTGYGMADREWNIPNGANVKYRIGSISKQFTAYCIMKLTEEGKLQLDDPLSKFYPGFPKGDSVSIRMLLNHTSGIFNLTNLREFGDIARLPWSKDSIVHYIEDKPFYFSPGERFDYCNTGYFLLACIVEKASGEPFDQYLKYRVLLPLGLKNTGVDRNDSVLPQRAQGYQLQNDKTLHCVFVNMDWFFGSGHIYTTIDDLYQWEKAYTKNTVLSDASRRLVFGPGKANANYGFGIRIDTFMNHALLWHTGDCPGFDSYAGRFMDDNSYIIILSNNQYNVQGMKDELGHLLYDTPAYFASQRAMLNQQFTSAHTQLEKRKTVWQLNELKGMELNDKQTASALQAYAGTFGGIEIFVRGSLLCCRNFSRDNNVLGLRHISKDLYQLDENVQVEFKKDETGHAIGVRVMGRSGYEGYWPVKSEQEKNRITWRANKEKSKYQSMPGLTMLAGYEGTYEGGLQFYRQDTDFVCKNAERGDRVFKLKYISGSLFQLDDEVQVEFVNDKINNLKFIRMLWDAGVETVKYKIN